MVKDLITHILEKVIHYLVWNTKKKGLKKVIYFRTKKSDTNEKFYVTTLIKPKSVRENTKT